MKKVLAVFTMIAFCLVALNVEAIDKNNLKKQKAKTIKALKSTANVNVAATNKTEFKGTKVVHMKDLVRKRATSK